MNIWCRRTAHRLRACFHLTCSFLCMTRRSVRKWGRNIVVFLIPEITCANINKNISFLVSISPRTCLVYILYALFYLNKICPIQFNRFLRRLKLDAVKINKALGFKVLTGNQNHLYKCPFRSKRQYLFYIRSRLNDLKSEMATKTLKCCALRRRGRVEVHSAPRISERSDMIHLILHVHVGKRPAIDFISSSDCTGSWWVTRRGRDNYLLQKRRTLRKPSSNSTDAWIPGLSFTHP